MAEYEQAMKEITVMVDKTVENIKGQVQKRGYEAANELTNAVKEVLSGQRSGRRYAIRGGGSYTASAPGEPPAVRTGVLRASFQRRCCVKESEKVLLIYAITESSLKANGYLLGELLENGTKKMAPRPFKEKTVEKALPKVEQIFQRLY